MLGRKDIAAADQPPQVAPHPALMDAQPAGQIGGSQHSALVQ